MICTIYKVVNTINNKCYIGFTTNFSKRKQYHKFLKNSKLAFHNAIRKYGWDSFTWEVIYCSTDRDHTLKVVEPYFIKEYNSFGPNGYNLTLGGEGSFGRRLSQEGKQKISVRNKDKNKRAMLGKQHTVESKLKISIAKKNIPRSQETRDKISTTLKRGIIMWNDKVVELPHYDVAVVIGRFQPFHLGHKDLIEFAKKVADHVIVMVGSSYIPRDIKNPFTYNERRSLIESTCIGISVTPLVDQMYSDQLWVSNVHDNVNDFAGDGKRVCVVGHKKDYSSYYLDILGYPLVAYTPTYDTNATNIRDKYFSIPTWEDSGIPAEVPEATYKFLQGFEDTDNYPKLVEEYEHIVSYKKQFAGLRYPPMFVTCDSVVVKNGHALLVKRKAAPGKGLWACPGGFLELNERIEDGIIRELQEETAIKVSTEMLKASLKSVHVFDHPNRSLRGRTITHAGLILLPNGKDLPYVKGSDDAEKARWFKISEVYQMTEKLFEDHYSIITYMINRSN